MAFRFLAEIKIDFSAIEGVIEERGKAIDWDTDYDCERCHQNERVQKMIYSEINSGFMDKIEEGNLTTAELIEWVIDELLSKCEEMNVKIIEVDDSGNPIDDENNQN